MEVAAAVSAALGDVIAAGVLFLVVIANVAIGFYQELKAERTLAALQSLEVPEATVIRAGVPTVVDLSIC